MFCFRYRKLLMPFSEGALDSGAAGRLRRHLASCARCREELAAISAAAQTLRAAEIPTMEPSGDLWARVRREIEPAAAPRPVWRIRSFQAASAMAAAAVLLFFVLIRPPFPEERPAQQETAKRTTPEAADKDIAKALRPTPSLPAATQAPSMRVRAKDAHTARRIALPSGPVKPGPAAPQPVTAFPRVAKEANAPESGRGRGEGRVLEEVRVVGKVDNSVVCTARQEALASLGFDKTKAESPNETRAGAVSLFKVQTPAPSGTAPNQDTAALTVKPAAKPDTYGFRTSYGDSAAPESKAGLPAPGPKAISKLYDTKLYMKAAPATPEEKARLTAQRDEYERRLARTPNDILTITALVETEQALGNKAAVVKWRKKLAELRPSDAGAWIALGSALEANSERIQAAKAYRRAQSLRLTDAQAADVNERLQKIEAAPRLTTDN